MGDRPNPTTRILTAAQARNGGSRTAAAAPEDVLHGVARGIRPSADREVQIDELQETLEASVGDWALFGLRRFAGVGTGVATLIATAFGIVSLLVPVLPGLGAIIFLGVFLLFTLTGATIQFCARRRRLRKLPQQQLEALDTLLLQLRAMATDNPSATELRQLRRVRGLALDVRGGYLHCVWQAMAGFMDPVRQVADAAYAAYLQRPWRGAQAEAR